MSILIVRHTPSSASIVRREVQAAFLDAGASEEDAFDAALIASELVSNAVRHAAPLPSGQLAVEWLLDGDGYRISVTDGGSPHRIGSRVAGARDLSGRGLTIVAALAEDWGVSAGSGPGQTTVWARGLLNRSSHTGLASTH
ncbi:MAG TPA: ATP-binding protein [Jatrophihabitans sp.]|nr:ATP-binding protein [Jatrophihabitans sp.]